MKTKPINWLWYALGALYFLVPLIATFDFSLRAKKGILSFLAYLQVLNTPEFYDSFLFSLEMAVFTIIIGILLVLPTVFCSMAIDGCRP